MFFKEDWGSYATKMKMAKMLSALPQLLLNVYSPWQKRLDKSFKCRAQMRDWKGSLWIRQERGGDLICTFFFYWHPELVWNESTLDTEVHDLLREKGEVSISSKSLNFNVVWNEPPPPFTFKSSSSNIFQGLRFTVLCTCWESQKKVRISFIRWYNISLYQYFSF